jgi:hypothetical protein
MRYFDFGNRLSQDSCALKASDNENQSVLDYNIYNTYNIDACEKKNEELTRFIAQNPNLRYREGYGFANPCLIDVDSQLRNQRVSTNGREKQQLGVRFFHAVPDVSRGAFAPNTESMLKSGRVDTTDERQCDRVSEKDFDRFVPLNSCMSSFIHQQAHVTPDWTTQFGVPSRETVRSQEFLQSCGYSFNGKNWQPSTR